MTALTNQLSVPPADERPQLGTLLDDIAKLASSTENIYGSSDAWVPFAAVRALVIEASKAGQPERDAAKLNLHPGDAQSHDWIEREKARLYAERFVEAEHKAFRDYFVERGEDPRGFERDGTGFYKGYGMQERWYAWYSSASRYNAYLKP